MKPRSRSWTEDERKPREQEHERHENERDEEEVQNRKSISAHVVYEAVLKEGESELERSTSALAFSGFAAGLSMGFSFLTQGYLRHALPNQPWSELISKLGYAVGFVIVILGRQQLFTENTLTPILPFLRHKESKIFWNILRLWATVFLANWLGTMAFALAAAHTGIIPESAQQTFLELGKSAMSHGFMTTFAKAIFAGWLIALLVWLLPFAEAARVQVIILVTYVIGLGEFSHVIAGAVEAFYTVVMGQHTWAEYLLGFMA